ncbi:MAG TPA: phosphoribosyltransferase family protein [Bacillota bacterium]|nr:phosphoribosyltransferase family protein [Bacillota bacterium]HPZ89979.1 phosphoribosyltransferase family protein [Bacillota bacterium]HQE01385.1 phosphoribosyltransferase family protein [Bacillota bacterium]
MFADRSHAGRELLPLVKQYSHDIDLVLAIPRGGVVVADVIARELGKPLKLIGAGKIGAPHNPELAIGAVAPDGETWINEEISRQLNLGPQAVEDLGRQVARQKAGQGYGHEADLEQVAEKGVLVVDDGAATGATLMACVQALHRAGARPIGAAVPVASLEALSILEDHTDYFLAVETPRDFMAVSRYYRDFSPVEDDAVQEILSKY